jgi:hypothetical protein
MMNWKVFGSKWPWPNLRYYPGIVEELKNLEKPQDNRPPGRNLNPGPPKYEAGLFST